MYSISSTVVAAVAAMSSSDSDSDSEGARLREAVDPEFNAKKRKSISDGGSDRKRDPSLRRDKIKNGGEDGGEPLCGYGLSVTKGFQEHVAKKLSESIEKSVSFPSLPLESISHPNVKLSFWVYTGDCL